MGISAITKKRWHFCTFCGVRIWARMECVIWKCSRAKRESSVKLTKSRSKVYIKLPGNKSAYEKLLGNKLVWEKLPGNKIWSKQIYVRKSYPVTFPILFFHRVILLYANLLPGNSSYHWVEQEFPQSEMEMGILRHWFIQFDKPIMPRAPCRAESAVWHFIFSSIHH